MDYKLGASVASGIGELIITYPIDYLKTIRQSEKPLGIFYSNPYRGVSSRFFGLVPMRIIFWNSLYHCNNEGYSNLKTAAITSSIQTLLDYPIEQIKIQKMIHNNRPIRECFKINTVIPGFTATITRNFGFLYILNAIISSNENKENKILYGAAGGLCGSLATHPVDTLKTHFQHNETYSFPKFTIRQYFNGAIYRGSISLISIGIGWGVYNAIAHQ